MTTIRLAFSPDSDDLFMFWALLHGKIDTDGLGFVHERADTEALNERAARGEVDVIAVSIARYAALAEDYLLLPHGASVGRGYGPVVVTREPAHKGAICIRYIDEDVDELHIHMQRYPALLCGNAKGATKEQDMRSEQKPY